MRNPSQLSVIARDICDAGLIDTRKVRTLQNPTGPRSPGISDEDNIKAKNILINHRKNSPSWKDPLKQKRRLFRSKEQNGRLSDPVNWQFSRYECYEALDNHIRNLRPVSIAHAIANLSTEEALNVNLKYTSDSKQAEYQANDVLEFVTSQDHFEYLSLLLTNETPQSAKDRALAIALQRKCMPIISELLLYHANPNNGIEDAYFIPAVAEGDFELVRLFLSAPNPLSERALNMGLIEAVKHQQSYIAALLISQGADANYDGGKSLQAAVLNSSVKDLSLICLKTERTLVRANLNNAMIIACKIHDEALRDSFVELLLCAGADESHPALGDLLLHAVKSGRASTVSLLINHKVSPNQQDAECLRMAVHNLRFDLVETILQGNVSDDNIRKALEKIPENASETEFENMATILLDKGVAREALSACLARAVQKGFNNLVLALVKRGASLDHDDAACIRFILRERNFGLLHSLLEAPCDTYILAKAIPDAMAIQSASMRRSVMAVLLKKGVAGPELHDALCTLIGENDCIEVDYELVDLLIRYKASVDYNGPNGNCIQTAARRGDLRAVELLCRGKPSPETASAALPLVFKSFPIVEYSAVYEIISLLVRHKAGQNSLAETLIQAVRLDNYGRIIALLLENRADPNYKDGLAIKEALLIPDPKPLRLICEKGKLGGGPLEKLLPLALDPRNFSMEKAGLLIDCCSEFRSILDTTLFMEVNSFGSRREVIALLLEKGASVDFNEAAALCCVVRKNDFETTQMLLSRKPHKNHISSLLRIALNIRGKKQDKLDMMRLLLREGGPGIGQDDALLQEVNSLGVSTDGDLSSISLLLEYGASVDYQNGASIQTAVSQSWIPLFDLLLTKSPSRTSLAGVFQAARRNSKLTIQDKFHIYDSIFKASSGRIVDTDDLSLALVEAAEQSPFDTTIPGLLLKHGASIDYDQGRALESAALAPAPLLVKLFLHQQATIVSNKTMNRVFGKMISVGTISHPDGLKAAQLLLERGIQKSLIDNAMSKAFSNPAYISKKEVELYLSHGADVNSTNGTYFVQAAKKEDMDLFRTLLTKGNPNAAIIVPALIQSVSPEKVLVKCLKVLADNVAPMSIEDATLFMAIERFPRGEELVRFLLDNGATPASKRSTTISAEFGPESVNVILWALLRENPKVSDEAVVAMLQAGSTQDSSFVTRQSQLSSTILAARHRRHKVMRELISQKADVSCRDHQSRSPLFYASGNGDLEMVRILTQARALLDDGSLHIAARQAHPQIVSLLLSVGHDIDFPASLHSDEVFGRTPLEELCLRTARKDGDATWNTRLRETMSILFQHQVHKIKKDDKNKSMLHLAIDNTKNPVDVTKALLEFPQIWKAINEPVHQFEDPEGFVYSPTKYVERFYHGPKHTAKELTGLLRGKRCQDRYFSSRGEQPEDAVGLPEDLAVEMNRRRRLEREQKQEMARLEELATHQREIRMKDHQLELRISDERHAQTMKQAQRRDSYEQRVSQNKHTLALTHERERNQQRRGQLEEDNKLKLRLMTDESNHQQALEDAARTKEIQYKNRLLLQDREAETAKAGIQKQLMWERDKVDEKQHGRQMQYLNHQEAMSGKQHARHIELLGRQDQSVKARAIEARNVAEAARRANMPSNLLQIEGPD